MLDYLSNFIKNSKYKLVALTGPAGAGKTTLAQNLTFYSQDSTYYSIDYRFIGDGLFRKKLLELKAGRSLESYIDACNQYNWWNWDEIEKDINEFIKNKSLTLDNIYDRNTGHFIKNETIHGNTLFVEGALLGPSSLVSKFDKIFFLYESSDVRIARLLEKDKNRRSTSEILARFLVTEYSENLYYKNVLSKFVDKIITINGEYVITPPMLNHFPADYYIPFPIKI